MSMKNSNDTIGNRTRDLPACSAVPQPTAPRRVPGRWTNDTDRGKPKYSEANLFQCQFLRQKSHMDWPGIEAGRAQ